MQGLGQYTALGYRSAAVAAREGRTGTAGSGDAHLQYNRLQLVNQSRTFYRDNPLYQGMLDRAVSYIVGRGFGLQATTKSKAWNVQAEALWNDWWTRPEARALLSGSRLEKMVARELFVAGDTAVLLTNKGLDHVEAEQIAHTSHDEGIDFDANRRPTRYWVSPYERGQVHTASARSWKPEFCLFLTNPERPSQTRTAPPCQAAFAQLHRINDVVNSEAIAWQMLARMALSITREDAGTKAYQESATDADASDDTLTPRITELDYALIFHAEPGDSIQGIDRNIPGRNFSESLVMFLRLLGLPLGLPLEVVLLDWTKSNYSQSRAVLEQAYQTFLGWQDLLESELHRRVYVWKITEWMQGGRLPARKDALSHAWLRPSFPWLDKLKETEAMGRQVDRGFSTHSMVCRSLNTDRDEIVNAREEEVRDAIERVQKIEKETGVVVPWEIFAGQGIKPATAPEQGVEEPEEKPSNADGADDDE
jgi:capsid protein